MIRINLDGKFGAELIEDIVKKTGIDSITKSSKFEILLRRPIEYFASFAMEEKDNPEILLSYIILDHQFESLDRSAFIDILKGMAIDELSGDIVASNITKACETPHIVAEAIYYLDVLEDRENTKELIKSIVPPEYYTAVIKELSILEEQDEEIDEEEEIQE